MKIVDASTNIRKLSKKLNSITLLLLALIVRGFLLLIVMVKKYNFKILLLLFLIIFYFSLRISRTSITISLVWICLWMNYYSVTPFDYLLYVSSVSKSPIVSLKLVISFMIWQFILLSKRTSKMLSNNYFGQPKTSLRARTFEFHCLLEIFRKVLSVRFLCVRVPS